MQHLMAQFPSLYEGNGSNRPPRNAGRLRVGRRNLRYTEVSAPCDGAVSIKLGIALRHAADASESATSNAPRHRSRSPLAVPMTRASTPAAAAWLNTDAL